MTAWNSRLASASAIAAPGEYQMPVDFKMSILVVDDSSTMFRITRETLRKIGFDDVDEANGGNTALAKMRTKRYDLVISDWNMEPMTGYDLLKQVRADPLLGQVPFIMVTGSAQVENVMAAKKAGVNNFIVKPFDALTMKKKIDAVFANT
jgi:two-component system, chemotaxis family, chemotaxis protein CheY